MKRVEFAKAASDEKNAAAKKATQEKAQNNGADQTETKPIGGLFKFFLFILLVIVLIIILYKSGKLSPETFNLRNFK